MWAQRDSNSRHPACKAGALNQLSYAPFFKGDCKGTALFIILQAVKLIFIKKFIFAGSGPSAWLLESAF